MTTIELSTTKVSPFFIAQEHVEAFGKATKDYNKFHEKYVYGSQITAWLKRAIGQVVESSGYGFDCVKIECRFQEPVENDSEIRLPEKITAEVTKGITIETQVYSGDKTAVEASLTYGFPERKEIEAKPKEIVWRSYPLSEASMQDLSYAIGGASDPLLLAFGLASPALQRYNEKNRVLPAGMPIYWGQTVTFYCHRPLEAGERISIGIKPIRKTIKGVGIVDLVLARKKERKTREGIAKARFFIGTAKPSESGLEKAVLAQTF